VIFIATTHCRNGAASASDPGYFADLVEAGSDDCNIYEGVIFGDSAYGVADATPVEMRDNGITDFGRKHGLAWYGIFGSVILEDDFIVRFESA
jgi:hypothetical protein